MRELLVKQKKEKLESIFNSGDMTEAYEISEEIYFLKPNDIENIGIYAWLSRFFNKLENAKYLYKKGNSLEEGIFNKQYEDLCSSKIDEYRKLLNKCFSSIEEKNFKEALKEINEIIEYRNKNLYFRIIDLEVIKVFILINAEEFVEAADLAREVLKKDKGNVKTKEYLSFLETEIFKG